MFKWILRGVIGIVIACTIGLFAAYAAGTVMKQDVLVIGYSVYGTGMASNDVVKLYDLNRDMLLPYGFPVEGIRNVQLWAYEPRQFLLMAESEQTFRENNQVSRREYHYDISLYDLDSGRNLSLMDYTYTSRRGMGTNQVPNYGLYSSLYPAISQDTGRLALYDEYTSKLMVYDVEEDYRHLYNVPLDIPLNTNTGIYGMLSFSPDGQRVAAYQNNGMMLVMNMDGSDLRYFRSPVPYRFTPNWSRDGRYILLSDQFTGSDGGDLRPLSMLDLESGEWLHDYARIIGRSASWLCKGQWIAYETYSTDPVQEHYHLLHMESGRVLHFSEHPILRDYEIRTLWTPDCQHLLILTGPERTTSDSVHPIFIASFDLSQVRLVSDSASPFPLSVTADAIIYEARTADNERIAQREPIDGSAEPESIGIIPSDIDFVTTYFDDYRRAIYVDYTSNNKNTVYVLDLQTGERTQVYESDEGFPNVSPLYPEN